MNKILTHIVTLFHKPNGDMNMYRTISKEDEFIQLRTLGENWTKNDHQLLYIEDNGWGYTISFYDINDNLEKEIKLDYSQLEDLRIAAHVLDRSSKVLKKYELKD